MTLFLIATIGDHVVAVSTDQVDSVVEIGPIVEAPGAPPEVIGLAALRSRVVTVIHSRNVLQLPVAPKRATRAIVTVVDGHHYAILVRSLDDVAPYELTPLPAGVALTGPWRRIACGTIERDGEPTLAIKLRAMIPSLADAA